MLKCYIKLQINELLKYINSSDYAKLDPYISVNKFITKKKDTMESTINLLGLSHLTIV